jgi:hypothetical protein
VADVAQVEIFNTALFLLGQEPVADLSEPSLEGSISATKLMRQVEPSRDVVLRRHGWLCALEYVTLAPAILAGYANWRYPTVYLLPANTLRTWEIEGVAPGPILDGSDELAGSSCWEPRWQIGTFEVDDAARQIIRAQNADASLNIAYVRRANWASLDAHVADAIACTLAARSAFSVTGDRGVAKDLMAQAESKVLLAISSDGAQEGGQPPWAGSIPAALRALSR